MRAKDINKGEIYRLKDSPRYGYIKVICVVPAKSGHFVGFERIHEQIQKKPYITVKCFHIIRKNDEDGYTRYFRPRDIVKGD